MPPKKDTQTNTLPDILSPAGDTDSFLAALAAGADAVYCGLKHFSARMEARNFSIGELAALCSLARERGKKTYIAINTLIKPGEDIKAARLLARLEQQVQPTAIIASDPAMPGIARDVGFSGEIHLSTLGALTNASGLKAVQRAGFHRAVLPREMNVDEIKNLAASSPIDLEIFIHGALCYAISGRCYWSSLLGGKSGLRGRCVQPCRRLYDYKGQKGRFFSCLDLGLDVLAKALLNTPKIKALKIEGRKKGAHYVYYTTSAYRLLMDRPDDATARKDVLSLLKMSLGRAFTHHYFLPQRPFNPTEPGEERTSGMYAGISRKKSKTASFSPRMALIKNDLLRIGSEEDRTHQTLGIKRAVPAKGRFNLPLSVPGGKNIYLIDRKEPELLKIVANLKEKLQPASKDFEPGVPKLSPIKAGVSGKKTVNLNVQRLKPGRSSGKKPISFWADSPQILRQNLDCKSGKQWIWIPPAIWPEEELGWIKALDLLKKQSLSQLVLGAPWQISLLPPKHKIRIWAGPFCNIANERALEAMRGLGCYGAFVSPELGREDLIALGKKSPLPLGIVIKGIWPACISRIPASGIKPATALKSPKNELFWTMRYGGNYWIFPNWELDLSDKKKELARSGFSVFAHLADRPPGKINLKNRPGLWNFEHGLL
ncbi:MAG: U32 family peptidase [Thermodesulfobacteriota bacterium]